MQSFTLVSSVAVLLVVVLLPSSHVVHARGVRVARQTSGAPSAFPNGGTVPVKFGGGRPASRPSVGALISDSSASNRNSPPPIVFGPRPQRFPSTRPRPRPNPWFFRGF
ncbi:uncharacterized protein LOC123516811 [Portunus trituberculatus]|uniref:Uncharacterized protein n=1 Tax=Portunus trituberculatus TaxID=210409 RepID=A0A5B7D3U4_PORTR|nr:uncharacterized protein LOC123516811 [Portunus trituberculatus]XP_045132431.1 uncharacterized protein LOC123516811 [Portunus trituberculatus]MPC14473.1 hypothetical protein [Portunus trituberculatus]